MADVVLCVPSGLKLKSKSKIKIELKEPKNILRFSVKKNKNEQKKIQILSKNINNKKELPKNTECNNIITEDFICYDVNKGFMLANSFYDINSHVGRINPIGWFHSEKYDGVRAIWNGIDFFTRNLTKISTPSWFKAKMPKNLALDGEFFIKRNYFNETSGIIRKKVALDFEWQHMLFMVFDIPSSNEYFENRMKILENVVQSIGLPLIYVKQTKINSLEELMEIHRNIVRKGAEGSILRQPASRYIPSRTDAILKIKDQSEEDAYILDWDQGKGRNIGKLGALWVRWVNPEEIQKKYDILTVPFIQFRVGSGFSDLDRCPISEAPMRYPKNHIVKVGFFGLQNSGKPRHPAFKGLREL